MTTWVCLGLGSLADFTRSSCPLIPRCTTSVSPLSSVSSRYLPSRPTDLMVRPSSRARKCLAEGWRRTERPLATDTALIFLPTTSRARSWRSVSTSGNSGIRSRPSQAARVRRLLLGVLLRAPLARRPSGSRPGRPRPRRPGRGRDRSPPRRSGASPPRRARPFPAGGSCDRSRRAPRRPASMASPQLAQDQELGGLPAGVEVDGTRGRPRRRRPGWRPWSGHLTPLRPGPTGGPHRPRAGRPPGPARGRSPRRSGPWPACPRGSRGSGRRCSRPRPGPSTASPRNSRRSLEGAPPSCSPHQLRWARAC